MYTRISTIAVIMFSTFTFAQKSSLEWTVGAEAGSHGLLSEQVNDLNTPNLGYYGLNGKVMFNKRFGAMVQGGLNRFGFEVNENSETTNYFTIAIEGLVRLGDLVKLDKVSDKLDLQLHAGLGGAINGIWEDNPSTDRMLVARIGLTPSYAIKENLKITADVSFTAHAKQNVTFDRFANTKIESGKIDGSFITGAIGVAYTF
ncbi:MAG: hypothetical protein ACPGU5_08780 [Lishizhenia sp.]